MRGDKHDLAIAIRHAVVRHDLAGDEFLEDVIHRQFVIQVMPQFPVVHDLVGFGCTHTNVGFGHHRVAHFLDEVTGFFFVQAHPPAGHAHPGLLEDFFHLGFAFDLHDVVVLDAKHVEIRAKLRFHFQPVLV